MPSQDFEGLFGFLLCRLWRSWESAGIDLLLTDWEEELEQGICKWVRSPFHIWKKHCSSAKSCTTVVAEGLALIANESSRVC